MDSVFGLVGKDYAILASDMAIARSILVYKHDVDKIVQLDAHKIMVGAGVQADNVNFAEYIQKNFKLYELSNDLKLNTKASANFVRNELATALRKGPFQTNILLAGHDESDGASLYWMDYLGNFSKVKFGAHGYAGAFISSVFDRDFKENMNEEEGLEVIKKCIHELKSRFLINQPSFTIKIVSKDGVKGLEL